MEKKDLVQHQYNYLYIYMYLVKMMMAKALSDSNHGDRMHHRCPLGLQLLADVLKRVPLQFENS